MVAAAQAAELALPAPGPRVLGHVPVLVHGNAIALRGAPAGSQRFRAPAHDLLEALFRDGLSLGPHAQPDALHDEAREVLHPLGSGLVTRDGGAQGGDAAADVVAHGSHGERPAGGHYAADGHAVAVMRVRSEDGVTDAGEAPRVLDLRAQRLLRL